MDCSLLGSSVHGILQARLLEWVVVQSLSCGWLSVTPRTAARQASLSFTISQNLLKLMSITSVMPSNHLILCCPLLLPPLILPIVRVFSNELVLHVRCQSIGASVLVLPMNIQGWFPLGLTGSISLQSKRFSSLLQHHSSKAEVFSIKLVNGPTLTSIYDNWENHRFDYTDLCQQSSISAF